MRWQKKLKKSRTIVSGSEGISCEKKPPSSSLRRPNPRQAGMALPPMTSQRRERLRVLDELEQAYRLLNDGLTKTVVVKEPFFRLVRLYST